MLGLKNRHAVTFTGKQCESHFIPVCKCRTVPLGAFFSKAVRASLQFFFFFCKTRGFCKLSTPDRSRERGWHKKLLSVGFFSGRPSVLSCFFTFKRLLVIFLKLLGCLFSAFKWELKLSFLAAEFSLVL